MQCALSASGEACTDTIAAPATYVHMTASTRICIIEYNSRGECNAHDGYKLRLGHDCRLQLLSSHWIDNNKAESKPKQTYVFSIVQFQFILIHLQSRHKADNIIQIHKAREQHTVQLHWIYIWFPPIVGRWRRAKRLNIYKILLQNKIKNWKKKKLISEHWTRIWMVAWFAYRNSTHEHIFVFIWSGTVWRYSCASIKFI